MAHRVVPLPLGKTLVACHWIYIVKVDHIDQVDRLKACHVKDTRKLMANNKAIQIFSFLLPRCPLMSLLSHRCNLPLTHVLV